MLLSILLATGCSAEATQGESLLTKGSDAGALDAGYLPWDEEGDEGNGDTELHDAGVVLFDAAAPRPDAAAPRPDAAAPRPDAAMPDAALPDAAAPDARPAASD